MLLVFKNSTEILNTDYFYLSGFYDGGGRAEALFMYDVQSFFSAVSKGKSARSLPAFADYLAR